MMKHIVFFQVEIFDCDNGGRYVYHMTMKQKRNKTNFKTWVMMIISAFKITREYNCEILRIEVIDIERM